MTSPRCSLVGAAIPRDGTAVCATDAHTGELFAAIPLAVWERLALVANKVGPCELGACDSPACEISREVIRLDVEIGRVL